MWAGDQPGWNAEVVTQQVETGKPIEYYEKLIDDLRKNPEMDYGKAMIPSLMKAVDESVFDQDTWKNDLIRRELFNSIRIEITENITEPTKNELLSLADELESDNTDIPEWASLPQIAEFIHDEWVQDMFKTFTEEFSKFPGISDTSSQMVMWNELSDFAKILDEQWEVKQEELDDAFMSSNINLEQLDTLSLKDKTISVISSVVTEIYGAEVWTALRDSYTKVMLYGENRILLNDEQWINFDQINVADKIMNFSAELTDDNRWDLVTDLRELSQDTDFDQNAAIEDIIAQTNEIDPQVTKMLSEKNAEAAVRQIAKIENILWVNIFSELFKEWWMLASFLEMFKFALWPEFAEALTETNIKKQKALLNLVKVSETEWEWFQIPGTDFSKVSGDNLKQFFASMDSYGISYEDRNFWEHLTTGDVQNGEKVKWVDQIHALLLEWEERNPFMKENYFSDNNVDFLARLNDLDKKNNVIKLPQDTPPETPEALEEAA